ncbi:MAG: tetratricopeptide repeat protein [Verrucomicrobiales bacterium]|nr:MAG: tetratricopeptide repeat protein [Verrucomicrobiales bacterium]
MLLAATLLTIVSGCTTTHTQRVDAPRTQMTVRQARKSLEESLNDLRFINSVREVKFSRHKTTFVGVSTWVDGGSRHLSLSFANLNNLTVKGFGLSSITEVRSNGKGLNFGFAGNDATFETRRGSSKFVEAVLILREAALAPDTEEADFAAFTASAKTWLAATPKPAMSDDARTQKVLAEDTFERKDFTAALDAYCDALDKNPMWPAGHYNTALLAAETEDYELAAHHMRRYLVLAPDAKDAQAAKDKLLLWQHKAKE